MSKFKRILWYFGSFYFGSMAIGGGIVITQQFSIFIILLTMCLGALSYLCFKKGKTDKQYDIVGENTNKDISAVLEHVVGLPIPEGSICDIIYGISNIQIIQGKNTFNLELLKITDITTTTDIEIQNQYVSSTGGAVGGFMLFGPLGAIVGGRSKKKKINTITHYLVITYMVNEEIKYITFEYDPKSDINVVKIVDKFESSNTEQVLVNL